MAIQYAGGTLVNTLTSVTDKTSLFNAIDSALTGAGWTITTTSSSTDKIYRCVATPQSNQIKVRVWDGGANCPAVPLPTVPLPPPPPLGGVFWATSAAANKRAASILPTSILPSHAHRASGRHVHAQVAELVETLLANVRQKLRAVGSRNGQPAAGADRVRGAEPG